MRNYLDRNDQKKLQVFPRATKLGLKFKNRSEEERYLKIVRKICQLDFMNQA